MKHDRFRLVLFLLVLILLIVSALFGVLNYWLGAEASAPGEGSQGSPRRNLAYVTAAGQLSWESLPPVPASVGRGCLFWREPWAEL